MAKKKEENKPMTRAQKTEAAKGIIKELLSVKPYKHNELIDAVAKLYAERYQGEDTENANDVKGRVGSVLDIMKKESEVMYDGGMYALKARMPMPEPEQRETPAEEKPAPKKRGRAKKEESVKTETEKEEAVVSEEEKPTPKKRGRTKKTEESVKEEPVKTEESVKAEAVKAAEEKPAPKKRGRKPKAKTEERIENKAESEDVAPVQVEIPVEAPIEVKEEVKTEALETAKEVKEEKAEESKGSKTEEVALAVKPKAEVAQKSVVMDMSFLFGDVKSKPQKTESVPKAETPKTEPVKTREKSENEATKSALKTENAPKTERKAEGKAQPVKTERQSVKEQEKTPVKTEKKEPVKPTEKKPQPQKEDARKAVRGRASEKTLTADEKLQEAFLKRMRTLGGDYFEYYSVYLLERYSMKNGRRLEGMKISGGDHDGGIDGEIELTDKFGFKETIYIQSKNWDPEKGKEDKWVVGETLLQQFIGACACRQAKDGKQHCRGIFVTTSKFTPEAKRILDSMSDKLVGYDGADLYEAAKECEFGIVKKNGEWALDEKLLSGEKAFFHML